MREDQARTIRLAEYQPPSWTVDKVRLRFELDAEATVVHSELKIRRGEGPHSDTLRLDGEALELLSVQVDGETLLAADYEQDDESLSFPISQDQATVTLVNRVHPARNTALEGLYQSADFLLTQCEAEGFRKITYFPDRPDVMAEFEVRLEADKARYPVLLSNGNPVASGELEDGRHFAEWHDPHPKPSYLFALVAGDLGYIEKPYATSAGRDVTLRVYAEHRNMDQCDFAMTSLINAMRWDEERFGLNYDLDVYNIVATDDFNMGAMENKGLNIFNSRFVLARPDTATDEDFLGIESVIGHEYFHNWTGNRVTCRDWFQLSLKEGLTVFRDQEFSADRNSRAVKRIEDVRLLRAGQFPEDAGPMAHPVRPPEYQEINNFYTATVYIKGAEVVRLYHSLLGEEGFQKGMRLYFERHDGDAVTTEDFLAAMADANQMDLSRMQRWYDQAGTPTVHVTTDYDEDKRRLTLTLKQSLPDTPGQSDKQPTLIPVPMGLLNSQGRAMPLKLAGEEKPRGEEAVLQLTETEQRFVFEGVSERPVVSLLRGFSAPVKLDFDQSDADLAHLMAHDQDSFNRWEASQRLCCRVIIQAMEAIQAGQTPQFPDSIDQAFAALLRDDKADPGLRAEALTLPAETWLAELVSPIDPVAIADARHALKVHLAKRFHEDWARLYADNQLQGEYQPEPRDILKRRLKNLALSYLAASGESESVKKAVAQFDTADNMSDQMAAMKSVVLEGHTQGESLLTRFYKQWKSQPLVVDKWFTLQAMRSDGDAVARIRELRDHPAFKITNPNKVRALYGAFANGNRKSFHAEDGRGYELIADVVMELDELNPSIAARLVSVFNPWKRMDETRQGLMKAQLERIKAKGKLSRDVNEIVSRALGQ
ncbi:aminopeptidase N [Natronospira proteinivora]|uniref:Aminopeptidase N n=1 Tax=Natronospira proteinivora TaxID=1807133 RepID=A0ABT1G935_9GAMM|nr:aminopeptidase N [Natronospira proteinivora]MCP1727828.1 aminopeptidase N [Natronospira proteinivora]